MLGGSTVVSVSSNPLSAFMGSERGSDFITVANYEYMEHS
jgi:hypothetical protein